MKSDMALTNFKHILYRVYDPLAGLDINKEAIAKEHEHASPNLEYKFTDVQIRMNGNPINATIDNDKNSYALDLTNTKSVMPVAGEITVTGKCDVYRPVIYEFVCVSDPETDSIPMDQKYRLTIAGPRDDDEGTLQFTVLGGKLFEYRKAKNPRYVKFSTIDLVDLKMNYRRALNDKDLFTQYPDIHELLMTSMKIQCPTEYCSQWGFQLVINGKDCINEHCHGFKEINFTIMRCQEEAWNHMFNIPSGMFDTPISKRVPGSIANCRMSTFKLRYNKTALDMSKMVGDIVISFGYTTVYISDGGVISKLNRSPGGIEGL